VNATVVAVIMRRIVRPRALPVLFIVKPFMCSS
jgi:hypothetical protein